jgi:glycogen operon protein
MAPDDWDNGGWMRTLGMFLDGNAPEIRDPEGSETEDYDFLLLLNAHHEPVEFHLPEELADSKWTTHFDTAHPEAGEAKGLRQPAPRLEGRSLVLLRRERAEESPPPKE